MDSSKGRTEPCSPILRVYTSRRMQDWDDHINGVLGAYKSTRHATTEFLPYILRHGAEKPIPLSFIYPEFRREDSIPEKYLYNTY